MKIVTWDNGEKAIIHCSWRKSERCKDLKTTPEALKAAAVAFDIKKISSGLCEACEAALNEDEK